MTGKSVCINLLRHICLQSLSSPPVQIINVNIIILGDSTSPNGLNM